MSVKDKKEGKERERMKRKEGNKKGKERRNLIFQALQAQF